MSQFSRSSSAIDIAPPAPARPGVSRPLRPLARLGTASLVLASLAVFPALAQTTAAPPNPTTSPPLSISGRVGHPRGFTRADLQALPSKTIEVEQMTEHGPLHATFTGALLWTVFDAAGPLDEPGSRTYLQHTLLARGTDGYAVALSVGELDPKFEGKSVIIAYAQDDKPLAGLKLVVPGDKRAGRAVRDLVSIDVR